MAKGNLFFGASGPEVVKLQKLPNKAGFKVKVDGEYQRATEKAVEAFQKSTKGAIKADQVAGPKTLKALQAAASGKGGAPKLKMTVPDYSKQAKLYGNDDGEKRVAKVQTKLDAVHAGYKKLDTFIKDADHKLVVASDQYTNLVMEVAGFVEGIHQDQQDFAKYNGKDEARAKDALGKAQEAHKEIGPQMKKLNKMEAELEALEKKITGLASALGKLA